VGCWEEVHYNPSKPVVANPVVSSDSSVESSETVTAAKEQDNEEAALLDTNERVNEVTSVDLFGESEEKSFTESQPTPLETVNLPQQSPDEQVVSEPQEPADTTSEVASEEPTTTANVAQLATDDLLPTEAAPAEELPSSTAEVMRPSRTALAVWRMSSRWSLAAAIYAKGLPEERYRNTLDQATYAAGLVGVELPSFPVSEGMARETAVVGYLLDAGTAGFVNKLDEDYIPEYQSLAELAIRTNALLLVYTPKSQQLAPLISSIRQVAENSGLPAELWTELITMLERREPFAAVKQQVLSFHAAVGDYLAGEE
jgi:hypothetical protein